MAQPDLFLIIRQILTEKGLSGRRCVKQFINTDDYRVKQNGEREREREKEGGVSWQFACSVDSSPHIFGKKKCGEDSQAHNKGEYSHSRPPIKKIIMQM